MNGFLNEERVVVSELNRTESKNTSSVAEAQQLSPQATAYCDNHRILGKQ